MSPTGTAPMASSTSWLDECTDALAALDHAQLRRRRAVVRRLEGAFLEVDGERLLAFCSNDYLGLAGHPALIEAACEGAREFGVGASASPLVSGHGPANDALERELAAFVRMPRALYFYAGYAANASIVPALVGRDDAVFSATLNHACLIDGARLSGASIQRYDRRDLATLSQGLAACRARRKLILSDAVFSMDGDIADVPTLLQLSERHDALLLLDDAHGFGVLGGQGRGVLSHFALDERALPRRLLYMATLGKAMGVAGAFVAGDATLIEWLLQRTRSYIFATAAPPLLAQAVRVALRIAAEDEWRRHKLRASIERLRSALGNALTGHRWTLQPSATPIQPLLIGDNAEALALMQHLRREGLWVPAIRPPTVPEGTARLRIALSVAHEAEDVDRLCRSILRFAE